MIVSVLVKLRAVIAGFVLAACACLPLSAQTLATPRPLVVRHDRGGEVQVRLQQIAQLRRSGQPVRIVGPTCYSSCTMLLGLPQTCVAPDAIFGFHGPSSYGRPLPPNRFEDASLTIARNYPPQLYNWYMSTARHSLHALHRVKGAELIRMGIRQC